MRCLNTPAQSSRAFGAEVDNGSITKTFSQSGDPEDVEFLEEAVLSGVRQAIAQGKELAQSEMTKITGGLGVTGLGL
jgi:DNA-binding protein YbaB